MNSIIRLEPTGYDRKAGWGYRQRIGGMIWDRMTAAAKVFQRELRGIVDHPPLDQTAVEDTVKKAVSRFVQDLEDSTFAMYQKTLEDGIAEAGVDMISQKLSIDTARSLYWESPVWKAYAGMKQDMIEKTNDIIKRNMLETTHIDKYGKPAGYNRAEMVKELQQISEVGESRAKVIARTENHAIRNKGKELGYEIRDPRKQWRYKWGGPRPEEDRDPDRMADSCKWIFTQVPEEGLPLDELKELVHEATKRFHPNLAPRDWSAHPNCRHFPQKVITRFDPKEAIR